MVSPYRDFSWVVITFARKPLRPLPIPATSVACETPAYWPEAKQTPSFWSALRGPKTCLPRVKDTRGVGAPGRS